MNRPLMTTLLLVIAGVLAYAQDPAPNRREISITAKDFQFSPSRIDVTQDDLVRITLESVDRPYSFAVDAYRIMKRVRGGEKIVFEFRADRAGSFKFYCNFTSVPQCQEMTGTIVVAPK